MLTSISVASIEVFKFPSSMIPMRGVSGVHTLRDGPFGSGAGELRLLLPDLEPNSALAVPGLGRLSTGHLGHVECSWTRVTDYIASLEADLGTGGNGKSFGAGVTGCFLVAADLVVGNAVGWAVAVFVQSPTDILPLVVGSTIVNQAAECV